MTDGLYKCYPRPPPGPFYRICERQRKTTQKADSLEAAIDYAMNRTKTEQAVFEDTIGCTNENAYADMVATKKRFHKMGGVQGYHLVQSLQKVR